MKLLQEIKKWIAELTEIGLLLVALGIVAGILFGPNGNLGFFSAVVTNLTSLLNTLGQEGLVGLVALGIILYLFQKQRATT